MSFQLIQASPEYKEVVRNLMQYYIYDFSEFVNSDVQENGLFEDYPYLEDYWKEGSNRFPYVIMQNQKYVGFVLVRYIETEERKYYSIAEFFVLKKYRREGIGQAAAEEIFNLHKGNWEVKQLESNKPAQLFWNKIIVRYTKGRFKERFENGRRIQEFES
ncbi:putative acetyltransferase [Paenibacillus cellulosilyticus]|uniref:Putative acetyltransferase n=1 Tax=Paenibacillus cellulosilyticus TaxID=375489 RepID=A0A2V2YLU0_9BACL|nr:GNAT family N-acetyltransferase [Paenibacillus cellulosilyticus]PWV94448.1 putative acetyltransferase [Paenibacillus cellulosilyticus]QKS44968.1 GNAT family N-acetyltransferase [Paenibacillus cellulosilyticus]